MIIYKTINLINNKFYIGKDKYNNPDYFGSGKLLKLAIKKYGKENFVKEVLQECNTLQELDNAERFWIKETNSLDRYIGYNIAEGGTGGKTLPQPWNYGKKMDPMSEEQKKKQSELMQGKNIGKENPMFGKEPWNKGIPMTKEIKEKLSIAMTGRKLSQEHRDKLSKSHKGKKPYEMTDEIKENIRKSRIGKKASKEARENMSKARKGDKSCAGPIVECPHCGKVGTNNAMKRWHFNNCKELKNG